MDGEKALEILGKYKKKALASGRVVKFPCLIGDTIYSTTTMFSYRSTPKEYTVDYFMFTRNGTLVCCKSGEKFDAKKFGVTIFRAKEEAENNIKEHRQKGV